MVVLCIIMRLFLICLVSGILGASGITGLDWRLWVILFSMIGIYFCGFVIGKHQ